MSGSYDRPTGPPTLQPAQPRLEHDPYQGPPTADTTQSSVRRPPPKLEADGGEPQTALAARTIPAQTSAPIVPAGSVTGRSLTLVITIMCFLACLTAGAVYMMNQSASAWLRDIASEVTVQVEAKERTDVDKVVADVTGFLSRQPGIATVRALGVADAAQLLEPWLGQTDALQARCRCRA